MLPTFCFLPRRFLKTLLDFDEKIIHKAMSLLSPETIHKTWSQNGSRGKLKPLRVDLGDLVDPGCKNYHRYEQHAFDEHPAM